MTIRDAIEWFQTTFARPLQSTFTGAPFSADLVSAIAYQETGYIWQPLVEKGLSAKDVLRLSVGDTLDADRGRAAFPRTKAHLLQNGQGAEVFRVARQALVDMAQHVAGYARAVKNPDKFCHGFGIFQYDLQFFKNDPDFFLRQQWAEAAECFKRLLAELIAAKKRAGFGSRTSLTDREQVATAIAYNRGSYDPAKGLQQGHRNDEGKFYGELVSAYYDIGKSIPDAPGTADGGGPGINITHDTPFVPLPDNRKVPVYPGRLIKRDSADGKSVKLIQQRLRDLGYTQGNADGSTGPLAVDGGFGENSDAAVRLFQARHTDVHGAPLAVDGEVGAGTWGALFGAAAIPTFDTRSSAGGLRGTVLDVASLEVGVLEDPPGSNSGKRVREYQRTVNISAGDPWCVAFVFWCHGQAAAKLDISNPMAKNCCTGGVLDLWNRARETGVPTITTAQADDDTSMVRPGMVFIISTGNGNGHTGLVSRVVGHQMETIEGNTNDGGSREGIGVFRRTGRTIKSINRGFIDFAAG